LFPEEPKTQRRITHGQNQRANLLFLAYNRFCDSSFADSDDFLKYLIMPEDSSVCEFKRNDTSFLEFLSTIKLADEEKREFLRKNFRAVIGGYDTKNSIVWLNEMVKLCSGEEVREFLCLRNKDRESVLLFIRNNKILEKVAELIGEHCPDPLDLVYNTDNGSKRLSIRNFVSERSFSLIWNWTTTEAQRKELLLTNFYFVYLNCLTSSVFFSSPKLFEKMKQKYVETFNDTTKMKEIWKNALVDFFEKLKNTKEVYSKATVEVFAEDIKNALAPEEIFSVVQHEVRYSTSLKDPSNRYYLTLFLSEEELSEIEKNLKEIEPDFVIDP
jgi:hypothetical protein